MLELLAITTGAAIIRSIIKNRHTPEPDDNNDTGEMHCTGFYSDNTTGGDYQTSMHDYSNQ